MGNRLRILMCMTLALAGVLATGGVARAVAVNITVNFFNQDGSAYTGSITYKVVPSLNTALANPFQSGTVPPGNPVVVNTDFSGWFATTGPYSAEKTITLIFQDTTTQAFAIIGGIDGNPNVARATTLNVIIPPSGGDPFLKVLPNGPNHQGLNSSIPQDGDETCEPARRKGLFRSRARYR
jgi:hypothetical protein